MDGDLGVSREQVLEDLMAVLDIEPILDDPSYFTAREYGEAMGISYSAASDRMLEKYTSGLLERVRIQRPGMSRWSYGYRKLTRQEREE